VPGQLTDGDSWAVQPGADFASGRWFALAGAMATRSGRFDVAFGGDLFALDGPDLPGKVVPIRAALASGVIVLGTHPLAAVFVASDDVTAAFESADPEARLVQAIESIETAVGTLLLKGLSTVVVMGLPDLGLLPRWDFPERVSAARQVSVIFNDTLRSMLAAVFPEGVRHYDT
jgi:hypothetical protein